MDSIPVKINEKYKPPPKITLPACLINRLNNTLFSNLAYDFSLESTVAEHMTRLNKVCQDGLDQHLEKTKVVQSSPEQSPEKLNEDGGSSGQKEPSILTPVPISTSQTVSLKKDNYNHFKYSDFENDTSSPFDNEELKTINDMEELAHVLGIGHVGPGHEVYNGRVPPVGGAEQLPTMSYGSPSQGHYYQSSYQPMSTPVAYPSAMPTGNGNTYQYSNPQMYTPAVNSASPPRNDEALNGTEDDRVSEIVKSLQDYIGQRRVIQNTQETKQRIVSSTTTQGKNPKTMALLQNLGEQEQAMAKRLGEMGFTLSSAVAAVQLFGQDESKIIEYLLLVQSFVEKGYSEEQSIHALQANSQNKEQAERYLNVLGQIMKLGFKEDDVAKALARTNNDRDKALDILIR